MYLQACVLPVILFLTFYHTPRLQQRSFFSNTIHSFYVHVSVHHKSVLINVQKGASNAVYILLQYHSTCFGCHPHPSSAVNKTVVIATDTSHMIVQLPHSNVANLATSEWGSCTIIWLIPVAETTVLCTPDDGCGWHPKHVEWYWSKIKYRLRIVASRWIFINILIYQNFISKGHVFLRSTRFNLFPSTVSSHFKRHKTQDNNNCWSGNKGFSGITQKYLHGTVIGRARILKDWSK